MHILQCPVCRELLVPSQGGYHCPESHRFDAAKQGYVNLLLSHQKHSKEPGDSPDMLRSRRQFLNGGFYDQLSMELSQILMRVWQHERQDRFSILDAGCGEGFYLKNLKEVLTNQWGDDCVVDYYGVDISKYAIRQATQRDKAITWIVASITDLPFISGSLDSVISIFSMVNFREFSRILRQKGLLIVVTAGMRHLQSLREIIYANVREHSQAAILEQHKGLFDGLSVTNITYDVVLEDTETIMNLLTMTPYFWNIDVATKAKIAGLNQLKLEVDVCVSIFEKTGQAPGFTV
jgi:23S rRNA (guanine745-N1)-methyltransferase